MEEWIPLNEYAKLMGISKQAVDQQIKRGTITEDRVCYRLTQLKRGKRNVRHIYIGGLNGIKESN